MNLEFELLEIWDFKSFTGGPHRFPLNLSAGLHFLCGRNEIEPALGANDCGKTTLTEALTWCLYGRTLTGLRNPDLVPWQGQVQFTTVQVQVTIDGKLRTITRRMQPNALLLDEKPVSQEEIEQLIGFNIAVWGHTVLMGQGRPLFFDLDPSAQLKVFNDPLELDRWEDRSTTAARQVQQLEQELAEAEGEIIGQQATLENVLQLMEEAAVQAEEWDAQRKIALELNAQQTQEAQAQFQIWQTVASYADTEYDSALTEQRPLEKQIQTLEANLLEAESAHQKAALERTAAKRILEKAKWDLANLNKAKTCPTCGQPVKPANLASHRGELEAEVAAREAELAGGRLKPLAAGVQYAREALERAREGASAFLVKASAARDKLDAALPHVHRLQAQLNSLTAARRAQEEADNPYRGQRTALRKQEAAARAALKELDREVAARKALIERTRFWVKGFKEVRLYIIEELLQELEAATNELLPESGLHDWQVKFAIERETKSGTVQRKLDITILSPRNNKAVKWESWGGGVGQRLRVIGALALSEVLLNHLGINCNLEILDEPSQHLSTEGVRDLCEYLADRARRLEKTTFYVDHKAVDSHFFASTVTVVKTATGSEIK